MSKNIYWAIFSCVVVAFFFVNDAIPILYDDLPYAYYYPDHITEDYSYRYEREMTSAWEIIPSQVNHYFLHGGRVIVHGLVQLFCYGEHKFTYNIFATLLFAIMIPLLGKICFPKHRIRDSIGVSMVLVLAYLLYVDSPNVLYHGIAFGVNYLYSIAVWLIFLYLLCFRAIKWKIFETFLLFLFAILAGWSHEGFSAGFCAAIIVWAYRNRKQITKYQVISIIVCCISAIVMVVAPGNFHRAEGDATSNYGALLIPAIIDYYLFIYIAIIGFIRWRYRSQFDVFVRDNIPLIAGWIVTIAFVSYIGMGSGRAIMGLQLITFILVVRLLIALNCERLINKMILPFSIILLGLMVLIIHYQKPAGKEYQDLYAECSSSKDTVVFCFSDFEIPVFIKPFVCQHTFEDRYWDSRYSLKYKKPIYVCDAPVVNFEYTNANKEPGKSKFYRLNDYLICKDRLPESVPISLHQGNYQKWDMPTLIRRVYFAIRPKTIEPLDITLPSDSICIGADKYVYYINLPLDESARKIVSVDLLYDEN